MTDELLEGATASIIRPGDTLVISTTLDITAETAELIKAKFLEECKELAGVLIVSGATVHTYRPTEDTP